MASASLSTREYGGHVVVALFGELDVVDAASAMAVLAAAAARDPRIIVDLAALEFIDCCALGRVRAQARQAGGDLLVGRAAGAGAPHPHPDRTGPDRFMPAQPEGRRPGRAVHRLILASDL